jgi:Fe-S-cluster containining protein
MSTTWPSVGRKGNLRRCRPRASPRGQQPVPGEVSAVILRMLTADGQQRTFDTQLQRFTEDEVIPCFRCGACCKGRSPIVTSAQAEAIARHLGLDLQAFLDSYTDPYPPAEDSAILRHDERGCVFLRHEGKITACAIYDLRPPACRDWQPTLRRPECLEGLRRLAPDGSLLRPQALFDGESDLAAFIARLT